MRETNAASRFTLNGFDGFLLASAAAMTFWTLFKLAGFLHSSNQDTVVFLLPWLHHILEFGRLHSLEASYANYNPPYLYLLSIASLFNGVLSEPVLLRLPVLPFMLLAAAMVYSICRHFGESKLRSALGAWIVLVLPDVVLDGIEWSQCDIIHTALLLAGFRLLLARRNVFAMAIFGVALSFKLQAIFAGPVVLGLLLAGEIPWLSLLAVPAAYAVMMLPAWLAGRPFRELLTVYSQQYGTYSMLEMNTPNPYLLIDHLLKHPPSQRVDLISNIGLLVAALGSSLLIVYVVRHGRIARPTLLAVLFGFSLLLLPYLLPKMHERYFFSGEIFIFLAALALPRLMPAAVLLQITAFIRYNVFLHAAPAHFGITVLTLLAALALVLIYLYRQPIPIGSSA